MGDEGGRVIDRDASPFSRSYPLQQTLGGRNSGHVVVTLLEDLRQLAGDEIAKRGHEAVVILAGTLEVPRFGRWKIFVDSGIAHGVDSTTVLEGGQNGFVDTFRFEG